MTDPPFVWLERRLFEVLGGWVPSTPEPEVKLMLRRHSFLHATHAERWVDGGGGAAPPSPGLERLVEAVAAPTSTVERLMGAYEVLLPALVSSYRASGEDGLAGEEEAATREGRGQLERLGTTEGVGAHRSTVATLLATSGL